MVLSSDEDNQSQIKSNDEPPQSTDDIPRFKIVKKKKGIINQAVSSNEKTVSGLYA